MENDPSKVKLAQVVMFLGTSEILYAFKATHWKDNSKEEDQEKVIDTFLYALWIPVFLVENHQEKEA